MIEPAQQGPLPKNINDAIQQANAMAAEHEGWLERAAELLINKTNADGTLENNYAQLVYTVYLTSAANCRRTTVTELKQITERFVANREDR